MMHNFTFTIWTRRCTGNPGASRGNWRETFVREVGLIVTLCLLVLTTSFNTLSAENPAGKDIATLDLTEMSLEDLMNIEVSSVSKKAEPISVAAAAIYVLTAEDIVRSGAMTIPDALRMVPGVQVAHIDANKWAVTARGFNGSFANKLLVLVDGRSVYTPLYSGVFWNVQDVLLEDIDRIEVIRGPGATLWGANAVNGVINILTKSASETKGLFVSGGSGSYDRANGEIRFGRPIKENGAFRAYGKWFERNGFADGSGNSKQDAWKMLRGGLRADWELGRNSNLTLQGEAYDGEANTVYRLPSISIPYSQTLNSTAPLRGMNALARFSTRQADQSTWTLQLYHDWYERHDGFMGESRRTYDIDFQNNWTLSRRINLTSGVGYRLSTDLIDSTAFSWAEIPSLSSNLFNAFAQTTALLFDNRVQLTLGSKLEHNDYTGFEVQPSVRLLWALNDHHSVWSSVSRAIRTPSRGEHDGRAWLYVIPPLTTANPTDLAMKVEYQGTPDFKSETLISYESGYRGNLTNRLWIDASAYYNSYSGIISGNIGSAVPPDAEHPYFIIPFTPTNGASAESYGLEIAADVQLSSSVRTKMAYSYGHDNKQRDNATISAGSFYLPRHQMSLQLNASPAKWIEIGSWVRFVDAISEGPIPSYWTLDSRLAVSLTKQLEFALMGKDLLEDRHQEFQADLNNVYSEPERRIVGSFTWRY